MPLVNTVLARLLVLALSAVSVLGQVAYLDVLYWHRLGWAQGTAGTLRPAALAVVGTDAVVSAFGAIVAITLVFGRDRGRGGRTLGVAVAAWAYLLAYGGVYRLLAPAQESAWRALFEAHFLLVECLGLAAVLAFSSALPDRLAGDHVAPEGELPAGLRGLHRFRVWLFRPWAPWLSAVVLTGVVLALSTAQGASWVEAPLNPVMDVARFATLTLVVLNFRSSWDAQDAGGRRQLAWVALGLALLVGSLVLLVGGEVVLSVTGWRLPVNWHPILLNLGLLGLLASSAMAVRYTGGLDPRALVRTVATWAGLAAALLFLMAALEALFSETMVSRISLPAGVGTLAAVGLFAWILRPTRRAVEAVVDQLWAAGLPEER